LTKKIEYKEKKMNCANGYDGFVVISNKEVMERNTINVECKKWLDECRRIQTGYTMDVKYEENKTILTGYQLKMSHLILMDSFCNQFVLVIPRTMTDFVETYYEKIILYIISQIRMKCTWKVANEVKYRVHIYVPVGNSCIEKMRGSPYTFEPSPNTTRETVLGRTLSENMIHFEFPIMLNENWNIVPTQTQEMLVKRNHMEIM
jgi:hypothetical protein